MAAFRQAVQCLSRRPRVTSRSRPVRVERLEERRLLAITVTSPGDEFDGIDDGNISLREAIFHASDGDTIDFAIVGVIQLESELTIDKSLSILGPGTNQLTIRADGGGEGAGDGSRVFHVNDGDSNNKSQVTIQGLKLVGGDTFAGGGAIRNYEDLTVSECEISGNSAVANGGGIFAIDGNLHVVDSIISGNSSHRDYTTYGGGGGIATFSHLKLASSAVFGNVSAGHGGGIFAAEGKLAVSNSTISGNESGEGAASPYQEGGGIFIGERMDTAPGDVEISLSTITRNSSPATAGGVFVNPLLGATFAVSSSIVADNVSGDTNGHGLTFAFSIVGVNPMLAPLGYHGGLTPTHAPLLGSPAIDGGDDSLQPGGGGVPLFDQRGMFHTRVAGAAVDVGAHESQAPAVPGDASGNHVNDAVDYVIWRNSFGQNVGVYTSGDLNGDGFVDQLDYPIWKSNFGSSLGGAGASTASFNPSATMVTDASAVEQDGPSLAGSVEVAGSLVVWVESVPSMVAELSVGPSDNWAAPLETRIREPDTVGRRIRHGRSDVIGPQAKDLLLEALSGDERRLDRLWRADDAHCLPTDREVEVSFVDSAIDALDFETGPAWNKTLKWRRS